MAGCVIAAKGGIYIPTTTGRDVSTEATGVTVVAPKFSDNSTLSPPGRADSAHHRRGRTQILPTVTNLTGMLDKNDNF